ncbi:hypothetical protein SYNPS1DRAFT_27177 [Syncephalis pseudoplumigaleata]|uniref:BZIP domain-containing protein n=1 Tax=Syncephalis pseudoplumigaleata TaxID=1712513 RepID=A0A4P9Z407_9FUNG|nr:hypothetical protein SYNPS1DRAFT_27177 [Syncephalis pseudoplumigaleata]|eukprot:RKP27165.1 hypothetical protein SYNPS1DRAFT_27177 [Syncephalis pseudoplumigaleata]
MMVTDPATPRRSSFTASPYERQSYTSGPAATAPPSHSSYPAPSSMAPSHEQSHYPHEHHDRRYQNAYMQQGNYPHSHSHPPPPPPASHHAPSYTSARSPLSAPPNHGPNYAHLGPAPSHDIAPAPPPHGARSLPSEAYGHSNPIPYGANHPGVMAASDRAGGDMGHPLQAPATYTTTFRMDEQHIARRPRTASFGGKPSSPPMGGHAPSMMVPSKRPASMMAPSTATPPADMMTMPPGMMSATSPRPIPLVAHHGQHSDDPGRMYHRDPSFHRMMPPGNPSAAPFPPGRPIYQPLTPSQSGSLLPPSSGNAAPPTNSASARRAAQNRAAQRAFRQRKERYMKELEYKARVLTSAQQRLFDRRAQVKQLQELARALFRENKRLRTRLDETGASKAEGEDGKQQQQPPTTEGGGASSPSSSANISAASLLASIPEAKIEQLLEEEPTNIDEDLIHPPTPSLPFPELDNAPASSTAAAAPSSVVSAAPALTVKPEPS